MYCVERVSGYEHWYLTEDMTWSDDPKRAWKMSKKNANFWKADAESRFADKRISVVESQKVSLLARLDSLRDQYEKARQDEIRFINNLGWGAGMRRVHVIPSFTRTDRISSRIEEVEEKLKKYKEQP